jgi:hypothetical protein
MIDLLLAAALTTAIDAEHAFAADAQKIGQWTAFKKYADESAVMFTPQAVWVHEFLGPLKDPPKAISWGPSDSWVSCDRRTSINRGPWNSASGKAHGYFTTVWVRESKGWKWIYDGGDQLAEPMAMPKRPRVERASCGGGAKIPQEYRKEVEPTARIAGKPPADAGQGRSADGTLIYEWRVAKDGERQFLAKLWDGRDYRTILNQHIAAPKE